jgi:hypothetical protein
LKRGWPDLLVGYYSMYGIEVKRHGGQLSKTRTVRSRRGGLRILDGQEDVFPKLTAVNNPDGNLVLETSRGSCNITNNVAP